MADEIDEDVNPQGEPSTPVDPNKPEPQVPLSRLREEVEKRRELEKQLGVQKPQIIPDEEKRIRDTLSKIEREKAEKEKQDELQLRKELEDLHTIYGDFDETKLLKVVDRYGVLGEESKVDWHAAMELYEKIGEVPSEKPKPKTPTTKREGVNPQPEVELSADVSKKSLHELVQDGLKKFGL